jgi:hypothetical protein
VDGAIEFVWARQTAKSLSKSTDVAVRIVARIGPLNLCATSFTAIRMPNVERTRAFALLATSTARLICEPSDCTAYWTALDFREYLESFDAIFKLNVVYLRQSTPFAEEFLCSLIGRCLHGGLCSMQGAGVVHSKCHPALLSTVVQPDLRMSASSLVAQAHSFSIRPTRRCR